MSKLKQYLISDPLYFSNNPLYFEEILKKCLEKHQVDMACFRDKSSENFEELAKIFLKICRVSKVKQVFLNSNINLAKDLGFDGVHLTSKQFDKIKEAKALNLLTIISCHNFEDLKKACEAKVDFVTYSPIFDTPNKGKAKGIKNLIEAIQNFEDLKFIALGGIISKEQIKSIEATRAYGFASIRYFV